eukprot:CAMPEP_0178409646 /NCGR_PEP_ID=MMETSP0689_2-20121128/20569_1 /TAXON_ID=160604 /ORGANISM="Amphidinium massartii, Strain CS-259" /LENGTH=135 /DNA_ID=CAMNT_0020030793 /DNA_START=83 /DNA_END=490 /DNA_ORIENTATION=+
MEIIQKVIYSILVSLALVPLAMAFSQGSQRYPQPYLQVMEIPNCTQADSLESLLASINSTGIVVEKVNVAEDLNVEVLNTSVWSVEPDSAQKLAPEETIDEDDSCLPPHLHHIICWLCYFSLFYFYKDVAALGGL